MTDAPLEAAFCDISPDPWSFRIFSNTRPLLTLKADGTVEANLGDIDEAARIFVDCISKEWALAAPEVVATDAARYRWLRDDNGYAPEEACVRGGEELDALCDAALAREAAAPAPKVFDLGTLVGSGLLGTTTPSAKLVIEDPGVVRPGPGAAQMIDSECIHPACGCGDGPCRALHPDGKAPA